jgi:hypothetical protein
VLEYWFSDPSFHYSITPIPPGLALSHFKKFQPHTFRPLEKADLPSVGQDAFFKNFDAGGFDVRYFSGEIVGIDGDMLEAVKLL